MLHFHCPNPVYALTFMMFLNIIIVLLCVHVFDITVCSPDHAAYARLQADGRGDDDPDQRSWRPQPGLQSGGRHDHQGPHQHARVCRNEPAGWTK